MSNQNHLCKDNNYDNDNEIFLLTTGKVSKDCFFPCSPPLKGEKIGKVIKEM